MAGGGTGVNAATGNVYLDGVVVGTISVEEADELRQDNLPVPKYRTGRGNRRIQTGMTEGRHNIAAG